MNALGRVLPPAGRWPGTMAWLIAASCVTMLLGTAAALALGGVARGVRDATATRLVVQVIDGNRARRDVTTTKLVRRLRATPGVAAAIPLGDRAVAALVAPYVGALGDLPLPALIDVDLAPSADQPTILHELAATQYVHTEAASDELAPLVRLAATLRGLALVIVALATATGMAAAGLAARAALAGHAATIAILHALGATDAQVTGLIGRRIARDAAIGAGIGLGAALMAMRLMDARIAAVDAGIARGALIGWAGWLLIMLLPGALIAVAVGVARVAMQVTLGRAP